MKTLLIADSSPHVLRIAECLAKDYIVHIARTGPATLKLADEIKPDLIILDIMLPIMHGIEVLHKLKAHGYQGGIIMTSYQMMIQNYRAALEGGSDYFLLKPFTEEELLRHVADYFKGDLKPDPFALKLPANGSDCFIAVSAHQKSYLKFWGTRGSNPVSGPEYVRHGGNTCSLEIRSGKDLVLIDAGTGIRKLGETLQDIETIHLIIGHTHWDHITGFPFFTPLYRQNCNIIVYAPVGFEKSAKELFTEMLAYAYFPVRLDEMHSNVIFKELRDRQPIRVGDISIEAHPTNHPGPTYGFRIDIKTQSFGYITDNELLMGYLGHPALITRTHPLLEPHLSLLEFLEDCDTVIHEAQYFPAEYPKKIGWGHSSLSNASAFIQHLKCIDWIITHHDPMHNDEMLQIKDGLHHDVLLELDLHVRPQMAYDGLILPIFS
ncbi:MAG: response regulator [Simkaniaceae bacterium]|nr:response regulator [Simkaniaceae bacterium]